MKELLLVDTNMIARFSFLLELCRKQNLIPLRCCELLYKVLSFQELSPHKLRRCQRIRDLHWSCGTGKDLFVSTVTDSR
jgi:hypothetical protein